ncbi:hypothetical protein EGW08_003305 [Elysia chlorotica]|uniref:Insulin-like domain-containing protein n=1 Tax=Elysia chlorotica TaxID=188477 RepID=A0A433U560_ELYCH|nr:hypothetical protein EGW08_003305 [Elysia chlorotica]
MLLPRPRPAHWCLTGTALLLTLALLTRSGEAGLSHHCDFFQRRPHPNGLCGRRLPMVLNSLCQQFTRLLTRGSPQTKDAAKRAVHLGGETEGHDSHVTPLAKDLALEEDSSLRLGDVFLERKSAMSYLSKRQVRGGIVCECCYNQCSVMELLQYCALPATL